MSNHNSASQLLNARQVAERLQVSVAWVLAHASGRRQPILPSYKLGETVRFRSEEIDAFVETCRRCMAKGVPIQ